MGFFDNLSKKATETYKNTTEKTNKIAKEMKLKAAISDRKTKIQNIYKEIGKKVYEKHIREENIDIKAELADEYGQIDALSKEIEDMNTEIRALKDIRLCKTCATEIAFEAKFCPKCGAAQENIEIKTEIKVEPVEDTTKQATGENTEQTADQNEKTAQENNTEPQPESIIYANTGKEIVETGAQNLAEIPSREIANIENNTKTKTVVNEKNNNDEETEIVVEDSDNE